MQITQLELQNVKSYEHQCLPFQPGTNAICGENGAGKTTILEAIGFALFDVSPYRPMDHFVREGEATATVTVTIVSSQDEREYQIVRRCGSSNSYYVYDPEVRVKLAEGKTDVLDWLREHLKVESPSELPALFNDAVGVPQGCLATAFQQSPNNRKLVFDRLLRVEEYDQAFKSLLDTTRYIKDESKQSEIQAASLETEAKALPKWEQAASEYEQTTADEQAQLNQVASELETLSGEKSALDWTSGH
jgi:exonuclease SbcC